MFLYMYKFMYARPVDRYLLAGAQRRPAQTSIGCIRRGTWGKYVWRYGGCTMNRCLVPWVLSTVQQGFTFWHGKSGYLVPVWLAAPMQVLGSEEVSQLVASGAFLVHRTALGHTYGILASSVKKVQAAGKVGGGEQDKDIHVSERQDVQMLCAKRPGERTKCLLSQTIIQHMRGVH